MCRVGGVLPQVIRDQTHPGSPAGVLQGSAVLALPTEGRHGFTPLFYGKIGGIIEGRRQVHDLGDHHLDGRGLFLKEIQVSLWPHKSMPLYRG